MGDFGLPARWAVALVLTAGAIGKAMEGRIPHPAFARWLPPGPSLWASTGLTLLEALCALLLVSSRSQVGPGLALMLGVAFSVYAAVPATQAEECGCLGWLADARVGPELLLRNLLLTALAALALAVPAHLWDPPGAVAGVALGCVLLIVGVAAALRPGSAAAMDPLPARAHEGRRMP